MTSGEIKTTHPIRGILWGIPLGLGLAIVLVVTQVIPLELTQIIVVLVLAIVIGLLWSLYGPAKRPKGPPPKAGLADDFTAPDETMAEPEDEPAATDDWGPSDSDVDDDAPDDAPDVEDEAPDTP